MSILSGWPQAFYSYPAGGPVWALHQTLEMAQQMWFTALPFSRAVVDGQDAPIMITGTGLTHSGSAAARDSMHVVIKADESTLSDSMKIFRMGIEGGKPAKGETGCSLSGSGKAMAQAEFIVTARFCGKSHFCQAKTI